MYIKYLNDIHMYSQLNILHASRQFCEENKTKLGHTVEIGQFKNTRGPGMNSHNTEAQ